LTQNALVIPLKKPFFVRRLEKTFDAFNHVLTHSFATSLHILSLGAEVRIEEES